MQNEMDITEKNLIIFFLIIPYGLILTNPGTTGLIGGIWD